MSAEDGDQKTEVRDQKTEVRDQKTEVRDQKAEVRDQKAEVRKLKSECGLRPVGAIGPTPRREVGKRRSLRNV